MMTDEKTAQNIQYAKDYARRDFVEWGCPKSDTIKDLESFGEMHDQGDIYARAYYEEFNVILDEQ